MAPSFQMCLEIMGEKSRSSENPVIFSCLGTQLLSGSHAFQWSMELSYDRWYVNRNSRPPQANQYNLPCNLRGFSLFCWEEGCRASRDDSGTPGDGRTTRLKSSGSLNHSIGRRPFKLPTPRHMSKKYTFCKLSPWGSGVVSYNIQPHHNSGDRLGSHLVMMVDGQFCKSVPPTVKDIYKWKRSLLTIAGIDLERQEQSSELRGSAGEACAP